MTAKRYLPLMKEPDGTWIDRPDLYLLARMAYPDLEDEQVIRQAYDFMVRANNAMADLNSLEKNFVKHVVRKNVQYRAFAGQVVLECARISATTGKPSSIKQATRLTAFNQHDHFNRSSPTGLEREVSKGFSRYRNTAHLQAAAVLGNPSVEDIEASRDDFECFLARARGIEVFIDMTIKHDAMKWDPWRVPESITANHILPIKRLNSAEQTYLKLD